MAGTKQLNMGSQVYEYVCLSTYMYILCSYFCSFFPLICLLWNILVCLFFFVLCLVYCYCFDIYLFLGEEQKRHEIWWEGMRKEYQKNWGRQIMIKIYCIIKKYIVWKTFIFEKSNLEFWKCSWINTKGHVCQSASLDSLQVFSHP